LLEKINVVSMPLVILAITFYSVQLEPDFIKKAKTTLAALSVAVAPDPLLGKVWIKCREDLPDSGS
jgi:hypothetical protein